jgi:hypothetical protein
LPLIRLLEAPGMSLACRVAAGECNLIRAPNTF